MKPVSFAFALVTLATALASAQQRQTYVGVITDTMCATDHKAMRIAPDEKCVRDCVADGRTYKYALAVGKDVYKLSDQETPAKFAGRKVAVSGTLYTKTNILKVDTIESRAK